MADHAADVTLIEVLGDLRAQGFSGDFRVARDGAVGCLVCGLCQPPTDVEPIGFRRLEGASDPGDMAIVLALTCPGCAERGVIVLRDGPEAGAADAALLAGLPVLAEPVTPAGR